VGEERQEIFRQDKHTNELIKRNKNDGGYSAQTQTQLSSPEGHQPVSILAPIHIVSLEGLAFLRIGVGA
jgi:hypothetical protein